MIYNGLPQVAQFSAIGTPTNPTKISNTVKSERGINYSNETISNHIDYLAEAFLIIKAERYDIKGRKYVSANLKYYFSDVGLRNARLNFRQQEPSHITENIVYNVQLLALQLINICSDSRKTLW